MLWTLILLIGFLPVSGALWAEKNVSGVVGRAITIDCHYGAKYRSHTKYWCHGWNQQCSVLVETKGQHGRSGRVSITDNPEWRIFTVTMEDLRSGDTGRYSCGITTPGADLMFNVHLQVSDEPVSVPVVRYLSPANVSRLGGSVTVSCESEQGSLPIQYRWYEQTSSGYREASGTNELALQCQSFNHQHHQYYCNASNRLGTRSSGMVNVTVFNNREICSYVTEINGTISGALWAEDNVRGVLGRAVTIDCHYAPMYRSHTKYLCRMWDRQCTSLVNTNGTNEQYGRMTIRDNTSQGIFTVTMENLLCNDTGLYRCGITTSGNQLEFDVHLQLSDVSDALWTEKYVRGVVGRTITIDCHYGAKYCLHTKYWCHGWTRQCSVLVETKGQHGRSGRVSITVNPERGIFTVTMEDLRSGDTGWYSCGITTPGVDPMFNVHLQVSDEPVSVPVLQYLSAANVSRLGGSVTVSCESEQGSLPIQYTWYENNSSGHSNISNATELDLHCQSFNHQHHQYYCSASNRLGARSSTMVNVTVFNNVSGALWAEDKVRGVLGRAVTIDCHYAPMYRSHTKYLCRMWDRQCTSLVNTNGTNEQYGRMTIRDNTSQGIFTVTMENLVSQDTGLYRCGITTSGNQLEFDVHLQLSDGCEYSCETFTTVSTASFMMWKVGRWLLFALLMISTISVMWFTRETKRRDESDPHSLVIQEVK
ncbi:polymeric immunoglobulin receptor-like isoform X2 [Hemitrygon akajei]|uniref:polymeric immunoglobulin receptor-like isoform X2 n=1 Tax=Hemitrygon akajei TaxID=2704970 RepID=UPI003BFA097F